MENQIKERFELARDRIIEIQSEHIVKEPINQFFVKNASFINMLIEIQQMLSSNQRGGLSLEELEDWNQRMYKDIKGQAYEHSFANPAYAADTFGEEYGQLLTFLAAEIRGMIVYVFEERLFDLTIYMELFIEVYNYFVDENENTYKVIKQAIYDFISDYSEITVEYRIRESLDPALSFARNIICDSDLNDIRYLYQYGEYISDTERKTAGFLNQLPQEEIEKMAETFTEGFKRGFETQRIDLTSKKTVQIRYFLGFERLVKASIEKFMQMGLEPVLQRYAVASIHKRQHLKIGYCSIGVNRQFEYDHRFDEAIYLNNAFAERKLVQSRQAYEKYKELAAAFAGPAVIEIFGESEFNPEDKKEILHLTQKQQKTQLELRRDLNFLTNEYIPHNQTSFTIIAYPVPDIGLKFKEIFQETVKLNTLDNNLYQNIQQIMIDELDKGKYVTIKGKENNKTDLKVMLYPLSDSRYQTIFENCVADVNIPVGEVFTSPRLKGTNGILHVSHVFLKDFEYHDLKLKFEDGFITEYSCHNFEDNQSNLDFIKENILNHQETLPMGEFAIGTNTTAYVMAKKYDILRKLPILIAEKTGPHFAVGDTCYQMSEDNPIYNPDGKEVVARDNECSILRKTDIEKAYFNCHTDITIPYEEIEEIAVHKSTGEKTVIIKDGRFVLLGTEQLNEAFH